MDPLYAAFEDTFRGKREDIKKRLKIYLPKVAQANIVTQNSPVLDIGCGRGEWLELLSEAGYAAWGLDNNRIMVRQCKELGFNVVEDDVVTHLQTLPNTSVGAVTGFHIIEHLPFEVIIKLLDETVRLLKPGGMVIFETPNPQNVLVGSHNFYLDPTHRNPLPSSLVKFLVEARGFCNVEIMNLHPYSDDFKLSGSNIAERFNEYFYGPQDYSVIGYKI